MTIRLDEKERVEYIQANAGRIQSKVISESTRFSDQPLFLFSYSKDRMGFSMAQAEDENASAAAIYPDGLGVAINLAQLGQTAGLTDRLRNYALRRTASDRQDADSDQSGLNLDIPASDGQWMKSALGALIWTDQESTWAVDSLLEKLNVPKPESPVLLANTAGSAVFVNRTNFSQQYPAISVPSSPDNPWSISPIMSGIRVLAIVALAKLFARNSGKPESTLFRKIESYYVKEHVKALAQSNGNRFAPSIAFLAKYMNHVNPILDASARNLFRAILHESPPEVIRKEIVAVWWTHLPSVRMRMANDTGTAKNEKSFWTENARLALILIGAVAEEESRLRQHSTAETRGVYFIGEDGEKVLKELCYSLLSIVLLAAVQPALLDSNSSPPGGPNAKLKLRGRVFELKVLVSHIAGRAWLLLESLLSSVRVGSICSFLAPSAIAMVSSRPHDQQRWESVAARYGQSSCHVFLLRRLFSFACTSHHSKDVSEDAQQPDPVERSNLIAFSTGSNSNVNSSSGNLDTGSLTRKVSETNLTDEPKEIFPDRLENPGKSNGTKPRVHRLRSINHSRRHSHVSDVSADEHSPKTSSPRHSRHGSSNSIDELTGKPKKGYLGRAKIHLVPANDELKPLADDETIALVQHARTSILLIADSDPSFFVAVVCNELMGAGLSEGDWERVRLILKVALPLIVHQVLFTIGGQYH